ncbi:MAG TPA: 4Fe-4S binding protein [Bryobacteraceae bacterium]|nr:4Fe-4S binding protein [Bryobacteraceae bacterium]
MAATLVAPPAKTKKRLAKRRPPDHSQKLRQGFQLAFLALNVWIGAQFVLFVRYYESGGHGLHVTRPAGVEGWLPIASLMNLKLLLATGRVPRVHPAGLFLLLAFLSISWLLRKSFCSWLCPAGTISEYLWRLGRRTFRRNWQLPRRLDIALRSLKYVLLGLFLYAVGSMSAPAIRAFLEGPYGLISDVKMLDFFRFLSLTGAAVLALLAVASVFVQNFWCRYLCPYGALMGLAALASPLRIRRQAALCIDCAKCAKACPARLPVDQLVTIRSAECTGCLECVAVCPADGALEMSAPRRRRVPVWAIACAAALLFVGICGYARLAGHWNTNLPERAYFDLIPHAQEFTHP